jgi:ABC-type proline/glycine betaine transport system permease subunit
MKKYFELITIPLAAVLLFAYNAVAGWLGLYTFTWEMFGKVFVAFLLFLVALGFVRIVFMLMFPVMYRYFDLSFINSKNGWNELDEKQRLIYASALFCVLLLAFVGIVNGL